MSPAEKQYFEPSFQFSSDSREGNIQITFVDGLGTISSFSGDLKSTLVEIFEYPVLERFLSEKHTITEIYNFFNERYQKYKSEGRRTNKIRIADSFYLNLKRDVAPFYTEIVNDRDSELARQEQDAQDGRTKDSLRLLREQLERENGPNIAEIEASKLKKQIIEGLLYGVPALICLYLIIKKIRS